MKTLSLIITLFSQLLIAAPKSWEHWKMEKNEKIKTSEVSFLNVNDASYLSKGTKVYFSETTKMSGTKFSKVNSKEQTHVIEYDGEFVWLTKLSDPLKKQDLFKLDKMEIKLANQTILKVNAIGANSVRVRIHNPSHIKVKNFKGVRTFPYSKSAVVKASFKHFKEYKRTKFKTAQDRDGYAHIIGEATFKYEGKTITLSGYNFSKPKRGDAVKYISFLFRDETNGRSTYGGGREVDVEFKDGKVASTFEINFNRTGNFWCAYTHFWNCPIGATQKTNVAIRAGEMLPYTK